MSSGLLAVGLLALLTGSGLILARYRVYQVPSPSMAPTLRPGDRILSDAQAAGGRAIRRGDIVILAAEAWPSTTAAPSTTAGSSTASGGSADVGGLDQVKRVIAVGGDRLACCDRAGRLQLNGRALAEPYVSAAGEPERSPFSVRIPAGHAFLLGDNRDLSVDSRAFLASGAGPVPLTAVRGRVIAVCCPAGRARIVGRDGGRLVLAVRLAGTGLLLTIAAGLLTLSRRPVP